MTLLFWIALFAVAYGIWFWLSTREARRAAEGLPRLSTWRLAVAVVASMVALFAGGCSLVFLPDALRGNQYIDPIAVLIFGGVPLAISALILWLALRRTPPPG